MFWILTSRLLPITRIKPSLVWLDHGKKMILTNIDCFSLQNGKLLQKPMKNRKSLEFVHSALLTKRVDYPKCPIAPIVMKLINRYNQIGLALHDSWFKQQYMNVRLQHTSLVTICKAQCFENSWYSSLWSFVFAFTKFFN